jgi:hypothetical protein
MRFTKEEVERAARYLKYKGDFEQLRIGIEIEREHKDITHDNVIKCARIAIAHITEFPNYYKELVKMEKKLELQSKKKTKSA